MFDGVAMLYMPSRNTRTSLMVLPDGPLSGSAATVMPLAPAEPPDKTTWNASNSLRAASSVALEPVPAASPGRTFCVADAVQADCASANEDPASNVATIVTAFVYCIG